LGVRDCFHKNVQERLGNISHYVNFAKAVPAEDKKRRGKKRKEEGRGCLVSPSLSNCPVY
jgi:hypothetical protein